MLKITPESEAGKTLMSFGVTADELEAATFGKLDWQSGAAVTLALPFGGCLILAKSKYLKTDEKGELPVTYSLNLLRHELCHVNQVKRWGFFGYWRRQLWARVQTRSLLARESDAERPCYEAQREAQEALRKTHPPA